jgi:hypothetical protein
MNITENFFKDVYEYEYGFIDEDQKNNELFKLNTKDSGFWENLERILLGQSDMHLFYISAKYMLVDNILTEDEYSFLKRLMQILKIVPYELHDKFKVEIDRLAYEQYYLLYLDDQLDSDEEQEMRYFSEIFGVDFESLGKIKGKVLKDKNKQFIEEEITRSRSIPESFRIEVYDRDNGRCVLCGSDEDIEYDLILSFSKGGSHDAQNIRILCKNCYRKKSGKIGLIE